MHSHSRHDGVVIRALLRLFIIEIMFSILWNGKIRRCYVCLRERERETERCEGSVNGSCRMQRYWPEVKSHKTCAIYKQHTLCTPFRIAEKLHIFIVFSHKNFTNLLCWPSAIWIRTASRTHTHVYLSPSAVAAVREIDMLGSAKVRSTRHS